MRSTASLCRGGDVPEYFQADKTQPTNPHPMMGCTVQYSIIYDRSPANPPSPTPYYTIPLINLLHQKAQ
jgi:hypothetical protein